jgi:hypothetical protein
MMKSRLHKLVVVALLVLATSNVFAKDSTMLIDKIPPLVEFSPQTPLDDSRYSAEQAQLKEVVECILHGKYKVIAQHIYLEPASNGTIMPWVALRPSVGNFIFQKLGGKTEFEYNYNAPNPAIAIWKVGFLHPERVALAMVGLPNIGALVGYFEVEKE